MTIMLETGNIDRFPKVGNYTSYCRCTGSKCSSNGKIKGKNNTKNGNKFLSWALVEAASHAIMHYEEPNRFYQRKKAKRNSAVAIKAIASKYVKSNLLHVKGRSGFRYEKGISMIFCGEAEPVAGLVNTLRFDWKTAQTVIL